MASKRNLKKAINNIAGDICVESYVAYKYLNTKDKETFEKLTLKAADLQCEALNKINRLQGKGKKKEIQDAFLAFVDGANKLIDELKQ